MIPYKKYFDNLIGHGLIQTLTIYNFLNISHKSKLRSL